MTASTAIASMFSCSATSGGTTTVAARNRRPHTTRRAGSVLLLSAAVNSRPPRALPAGLRAANTSSPDANRGMPAGHPLFLKGGADQGPWPVCALAGQGALLGSTAAPCSAPPFQQTEKGATVAAAGRDAPFRRGAAASTLRKPSCGSRPGRIDPFKDGDRRTAQCRRKAGRSRHRSED